jgi:hypothetical protein
MPAKKDDAAVTNGAPAQPAPAPVPAPLVPAPVFLVPAPVAPVTTDPAVKLDESIPGGRFMVGGRLVNSEGQPINEDGTLIKES